MKNHACYFSWQVYIAVLDAILYFLLADFVIFTADAFNSCWKKLKVKDINCTLSHSSSLKLFTVSLRFIGPSAAIHTSVSTMHYRGYSVMTNYACYFSYLFRFAK